MKYDNIYVIQRLLLPALTLPINHSTLPLSKFISNGNFMLVISRNQQQCLFFSEMSQTNQQIKSSLNNVLASQRFLSERQLHSQTFVGTSHSARAGPNCHPSPSPAVLQLCGDVPVRVGALALLLNTEICERVSWAEPIKQTGSSSKTQSQL